MWLAISAITSYIFGIAMTADGLVRFVLQFRVQRSASRPIVAPGVFATTRERTTPKSAARMDPSRERKPTTWLILYISDPREPWILPIQHILIDGLNISAAMHVRFLTSRSMATRGDSAQFFREVTGVCLD